MLFTKMQGLGNDYLYVYGDVPEDAAQLSEKLSDRHFGAGSDGMIYISPSGSADFKMRIFNADGSEAKMCGNGIRCVGKYVYDKGYTDKTRLTIETMSGIRTLELDIRCGKVRSVTVDMGRADVGSDMEVPIGEDKVICTPVNVGNPHAVIFIADTEKAPVAVLGPQIEKHSLFPDGVNVEFVQVISDRKFRMRVWERGSGITMACGTGACASAAAAVRKSFCRSGEPITVVLDGGELKITAEPDNSISMRGSAEFVYEGEVQE